MTTEELLALPDDRIERWLIRGQIREKRARHRDPARPRILDQGGDKALDRIAACLLNWLERRPHPREMLVPSETVCRVDGGGTRVVVEIACPDDSYGEIWERIERHQNAAVALVWLVCPSDGTITVHRLDAAPELVNIRQDLSGEPHLPGFRVPVAEIFA